MILDRKIENYIVHIDTPLSVALKKIALVKGRILFGIDEHSHLKGVLTNGDLIRWLTDCKDNVDLGIPISEVLNYQYSSVYEEDLSEKILPLLESFLFVPVVDQQKHLVAVAHRRTNKDNVLSIEDKRISVVTPVYIIAEIGNNHNGCLDRAKRLIDAAIRAGADCAKFQMRNLKSLYKNSGDSGDAKENLGSQYTLDLLNRVQLSNDDMFAAFDYCKQQGITPLCTPWDISSVELLEGYGLAAYKVASADLTNHDLIKCLADTGKPLILSTGMSRELEIQQTVDILRMKGAQYALLHCNSCYPPPFKDIHLNYLKRLQEIGQTVVGYSGHERDIFVAVAAVASGARIIEKHFTEDRSLEGSDHKVSLLPEEFARMVEGIRQVDSALGQEGVREITQGEMMNRATLAKSIFINQSLKQGEQIEADMIEVKSPGHGLQPNYKDELIGKMLQRNMLKGDVFYESDLKSNKNIEVSDYNFKRSWGVPVRFHDYKTLMKKTNLSLLEFHLSYKDMELDLADFFDETLDLNLIVHSPELFSGDHVLDLCSPDEEYRKQSVQEMQRVINFTKKLRQYFTKQCPIGIVTNVGGFSESAPLNNNEKKIRLAQLKSSLSQLDTEGVEIWPQTMPPYPWHFGGQRFHNIFVDADEIVQFCKENGYRICLDISHSKLATNHRKKSFMSFTEQVAPYTAHLHIADAKGIDDEGLQIGEGDIDFVSFSRVLDENSVTASMIPEIWQGHENEGEGFWIALNKLKGHL